jgi:hypothetical protein
MCPVKIHFEGTVDEMKEFIKELASLQPIHASTMVDSSSKPIEPLTVGRAAVIESEVANKVDAEIAKINNSSPYKKRAPKLTDDQKKVIVALNNSGATPAAISKRLGLSYTTVYNCLQHRNDYQPSDRDAVIQPATETVSDQPKSEDKDDSSQDTPPKALSRFEMDLKIDDAYLKDKMSPAEISEKLQVEGYAFSESMVKRRLESFGHVLGD